MQLLAPLRIAAALLLVLPYKRLWAHSTRYSLTARKCRPSAGADPILARRVISVLDWLVRLVTLGADGDTRARLSISRPEDTSSPV